MSLRRTILSLMLCLALLVSVLPVSASAAGKDFDIVGEWMWSDTVYKAGAGGVNEIFSRCAEMGVTDVYLLVKGTKGTVSFNNTQVALEKSYADRDVLQESIDAAHDNGIRLHAWFMSIQDNAYKAAHPDAGLAHYKRGKDNANINPTDAGYNAYMDALVAEVAKNYDVDGIHFDNARYNHACNGWSTDDVNAIVALANNPAVTAETVKHMIDHTFYDTDKDANYIFDQYNAGDPSAVAIAKYRSGNIKAFAQGLVNAARAVNKNLIISAATMPEGAYDVAFGDLHYGQDYKDAATLYDYICPMAYTKDYGKTAAWVAQVLMGAIDKGNKVVAGLQSYYPSTSGTLMADVEAVRGLLSSKNYAEFVEGIANFRNSQFAYAKVSHNDFEGALEVKLINELTGVSKGDLNKVVVELQDGLTAIDAAILSGFDAAAGITISKDGKSIEFSAATLLAAGDEGVLHINFKGIVDTADSVALVRVYGSNETRAYHVFEYLPNAHRIIMPPDDLCWYPENTVCTAGIAFRDVKPELTNKWYNFTPIDLSQQGTQVIDMVASNMYVVGRVVVQVDGDSVKVTWERANAACGDGNFLVSSEFFTFFPDLASVTTVEPSELTGYAFGQTVSIKNDLKDDTNVLLYMRNVATYCNYASTASEHEIPYARYLTDQTSRVREQQALLDMMDK